MKQQKTPRFGLKLLAASLCLLAGQAGAAVIGFEGVAAPNTQTGEDGANRVFDGFNVFIPHGHIQGVGFAAGTRPQNGSDWLLHDHFSGTLGQPVVVTKLGGGAFSALSIDAAEWDNGLLKGQTLTLTGHLSGGGTVVQNFVTDQLDGFEQFTLAGFDDIVQLDIIGSTNGTGFGALGYDNIVLGDPINNRVPVPMSLGLALLALGVATGARRR